MSYKLFAFPNPSIPVPWTITTYCSFHPYPLRWWTKFLGCTHLSPYKYLVLPAQWAQLSGRYVLRLQTSYDFRLSSRIYCGSVCVIVSSSIFITHLIYFVAGYVNINFYSPTIRVVYAFIRSVFPFPPSSVVCMSVHSPNALQNRHLPHNTHSK